MLRYLIKTLLQMNLFTDTIRNPSNGTDLFFNVSLPTFNSSLLDWGNFTGFNGKHREYAFVSSPLSSLIQPPLWFVFALFSWHSDVRRLMGFLEKDWKHLQWSVFCYGNVELSWRGSWKGKVEGVVMRVNLMWGDGCLKSDEGLMMDYYFRFNICCSQTMHNECHNHTV